ncbi:Uncharacterised protein [uncultured Eubacterium sp.]|nr:Uncharacterised protein [uncultured Eubacterium sp.]
MKNYSEKELNIICNSIRREIKEENNYLNNSIYMNRVDIVLDVLQRFVLKIQEDNRTEE